MGLSPQFSSNHYIQEAFTHLQLPAIHSSSRWGKKVTKITAPVLSKFTIYNHHHKNTAITHCMCISYHSCLIKLKFNLYNNPVKWDDLHQFTDRETGTEKLTYLREHSGK